MGYAADNPPIARELLLENCMGKKQIMFRILNRFAEAAPKTLQALQQALEDGNLQEMARHGHTICGIAANIAAEPLRTRAAEVEQKAMEGDEEGAQKAVDLLFREAQRCLDSVRSACPRS